jgi:hypothetical protein
MAYDTDTSRRRKPAVPKGYRNAEEFLSEMRKRFDQGIEADNDNRIAALEDIRFTFGEQWDSNVLKQRKRARKPCLTINRLPAFVAQIIGNRLMNETEIRVYPMQDGTREIAEVRQGIIKAIFRNSQSDFARDEAMKYQTICGIGAFQLCLEYNNDEVFYQDAKIEPIANPFAAVFDPMAVLPCAGDSRFAFVVDDIAIGDFKARYPWAATTGFGDSAATTGTGTTTWYASDCIKVVSYWRRIEDGRRTIALLQSGSTVEIEPEMLEERLSVISILPDGSPNPEAIVRRPDGTPMVRDVPRIVCQKYLCSGGDILEGPYTLPVSSVPVYRVPGWELREGDKVHRWGLVRLLKDPQRLHNYQRSIAAEQMVAAPRNKWVATKEAVAGYEKEWRNSHLSDDPLLIYNSEGMEPKRQDPPALDAALLTETQMSVQDIRDVSNIHEASLGQKSNEVSGRAIQARQSVSDLGSFVYHDRLRIAEERCAKNLLELIPTVYDTMRTVTILGEKDKALQVVINDPTDPDSDITMGKYGLTVTTGPATVTKRALAAEQMMTFVNAAPESAVLVMDLVAEAQDWPQASEFARRFRLNLPPGVVPPDELPPEMQEMQEQQSQAAQMAAEIDMKLKEAEIQAVRAEVAERMARAVNLRATARKALSDADARARDVDAKVETRDSDKIFKAMELANSLQEDGDDDRTEPRRKRG